MYVVVLNSDLTLNILDYETMKIRKSVDLKDEKYSLKLDPRVIKSIIESPNDSQLKLHTLSGIGNYLLEIETVLNYSEKIIHQFCLNIRSSPTNVNCDIYECADNSDGFIISASSITFDKGEKFSIWSKHEVDDDSFYCIDNNNHFVCLVKLDINCAKVCQKDVKKLFKFDFFRSLENQLLEYSIKKDVNSLQTVHSCKDDVCCCQIFCGDSEDRMSNHCLYTYFTKTDQLIINKNVINKNVIKERSLFFQKHFYSATKSLFKKTDFGKDGNIVDVRCVKLEYVIFDQFITISENDDYIIIEYISKEEEDGGKKEYRLIVLIDFFNATQKVLAKFIGSSIAPSSEKKNLAVDYNINFSEYQHYFFQKVSQVLDIFLLPDLINLVKR
jgi:hypothetical protein